MAPWPVVEEAVRDVLAAGAGRPAGTCSTSGTACCRSTDPGVLTRIVELVHTEGVEIRRTSRQ